MVNGDVWQRSPLLRARLAFAGLFRHTARFSRAAVSGLAQLSVAAFLADPSLARSFRRAGAAAPPGREQEWHITNTC
jgi:hypothetical protein